MELGMGEMDERVDDMIGMRDADGELGIYGVEDMDWGGCGEYVWVWWIWMEGGVGDMENFVKWGGGRYK